MGVPDKRIPNNSREVVVRSRHIVVPALAALVAIGMTPGAGNALSAIRHQPAAAARPASGGAHHQFSLSAGGGRTGDLFGSAVAVSKNVIVVGAPFRTVNGHKRQGAAYVFVKPASGWGHAKVTAVLTIAKGRAFDYFGAAVAIAGNTIAVSAPFVSSGSNVHQGAVYLFTKPAAGWGALHHPTGRLFPSDRNAQDTFGGALAGSGNTFVVGAPLHVVGQHPKQGSAYVFTRPAGGWMKHTVQTAELSPAAGSAGEEIGYAVAISGRTVVAGAPYVKVAGHVGAGAAFAFTEPSTGWRDSTHAAELTLSHPASAQYVGYSVGVSGSTVAVGAPDTTVGSHKLQGAGYVFVKPSSGGWQDAHQSATLTVTPGNPGAYFGEGIAASGTRIAGTGFGLLSVFSRGGGWHGTQHQQAQLSGPDSLDFLGKAVAMSGSTIVAGAPTQTVGRHLGQGAIYVYVR
jgi:hypothetical protein